MQLKFVKINELKLDSGLHLPVTDEDARQIEQSLSKLGFVIPILTIEGKVINGYTRLEIAKKQGVTEVPVVELSNDEFKQLQQKGVNEEYMSILINLAQRHLSKSQKYELIAKLAEFEREKALERKKAGVEAAKEEKGSTREKVARMIGVSPETVRRILKIKDDPELLEKVKSGELSLAKAAEIKEQKEKGVNLELPVEIPENSQPEIKVEDPRVKELRKLSMNFRTIVLDNKIITEHWITGLVIAAINIVKKALEYITVFRPHDREKIMAELEKLISKYNEQEKKQKVANSN